MATGDRQHNQAPQQPGYGGRMRGSLTGSFGSYGFHVDRQPVWVTYWITIDRLIVLLTVFAWGSGD